MRYSRFEQKLGTHPRSVNNWSGDYAQLRSAEDLPSMVLASVPDNDFALILCRDVQMQREEAFLDFPVRLPKSLLGLSQPSQSNLDGRGWQAEFLIGPCVIFHHR